MKRPIMRIKLSSETIRMLMKPSLIPVLDDERLRYVVGASGERTCKSTYFTCIMSGGDIC